MAVHDPKGWVNESAQAAGAGFRAGASRLTEIASGSSKAQYQVTGETMEALYRIWLDPRSKLEWVCPFVLPFWLEAWWKTFHEGAIPLIRAVHHEGECIGVAPLLLEGAVASFIGSENVCDYQDFVVAPGRTRDFSGALIEALRSEGVGRLELGVFRPDSVVMTEFIPAVRELGCAAVCEPGEVAMEIGLPGTWDEFLTALDKKKRHELQRKLRRLHEAGRVTFETVETESKEAFDEDLEKFLLFFKASSEDKASFLTDRMSIYFRTLAEAAARFGALKLSFLQLDGERVAGVLCFEWRTTTYLYNNGYDPKFHSLSVGLMSKVLSIQESIRERRTRYDLLKGSETYKYRLGGTEVPLYRCAIDLS